MSQLASRTNFEINLNKIFSKSPGINCQEIGFPLYLPPKPSNDSLGLPYHQLMRWYWGQTWVSMNHLSELLRQSPEHGLIPTAGIYIHSQPLKLLSLMSDSLKSGSIEKFKRWFIEVIPACMMLLLDNELLMIWINLGMRSLALQLWNFKFFPIKDRLGYRW